MYIVIVGGGQVGVQLTKRLIAREHEVLLVEKDPRQAQKLATVLGEDHVYFGDGCEMRVQKDVGFERADVVVAVTGDDEDNLVICQMAKAFWDVNRVVARVNNPSHEQIFRSLGIDDIVSATSIIFSLVEQQINLDELVTVGALAMGRFEVVETILSSRSPLLHRKVKDIILPANTHFVWASRDGESVPITADFEFLQDDTVLLVVPGEKIEELKDLLNPSKVGS
jgi:trk system potassium uptake protein TrkA